MMYRMPVQVMDEGQPASSACHNAWLCTAAHSKHTGYK